jgi:hypothetical protein
MGAADRDQRKIRPLRGRVRVQNLLVCAACAVGERDDIRIGFREGQVQARISGQALGVDVGVAGRGLGIGVTEDRSDARQGDSLGQVRGVGVAQLLELDLGEAGPAAGPPSALGDFGDRPALFAGGSRAMLMSMQPLKAHVRNGRLVLDTPTDLPDGTEVELVPADAWDGLDDEDRRKLHEALVRSEDDVRAGRVVPAEAFLAELRRSGG